MISDTLFDAGQEIDRYLDDPVMGKCYTGPMRARILALRADMREIQRDLDVGPTLEEIALWERARKAARG